MWFPSAGFRDNYTQITTLSIFGGPERGHFRVNGCINTQKFKP
jgi:predicted aspartyl protease